MLIVPVTGDSFYGPACVKCGGKVGHLRDAFVPTVYADLDGEAFKAYYHASCVPALESEVRN
jgi:hypothetical protein